MVEKNAHAYCNNGYFPFRYVKRSGKNSKSLSNLSHGYRTLGISSATQRKIVKHARVLGISAEPIRVRDNKGNYVQHRMSFITLTLPAEQRHEDKEITNRVLQTFLDRGRKLGLFANYLWRAEKQKNGNIHYHLLTDTRASYTLIYNLWLLSLEMLGYVSRYTKKFESMPFSVYLKLPFNAKSDVNVVSARYAKGVRNFWRKPPCVDVEYLDSLESVNLYISKYVAKEESGDNSNIVTGRVWACSRSLSSAVKEFCSNQDINSFWFNIGMSIMRKKVVRHDYFDYVLFSFTSACAWYPDFACFCAKILRSYITPCSYYSRLMGASV